MLALSTLVNTVGRGIFMTLSALYFTRVLGFSALQVGTGLAIAAVFAFAGGIPLGHLGDRRGAREVLVALLVLQGVFTGLVLVAQTYWQFVLVVSITQFVGSGANAVRGGLIAAAVTGSRRSATRAYLRSITNIGITVGTGIAAIALHFDTRAAYMSVLYVDVLTFLLAACVTLRLPRLAPAGAEVRASMWLATRDLPYLAVTISTGLLAMHYWIIEMALPLWVVEHTDAPRWAVSALMILNTTAVILYQVPVARRIRSLRAARLASLLSGALLLLACATLGLADGLGPWVALGVLVVGALVHVAGELVQAGAGFTIGFDLAPDHAQGQYQGLYGTSWSLASLVAPPLMALLPLGLGTPGWLLLGLVLLIAAGALALATRWAEGTRDRYALTRAEAAPAA